MTKIWVALQTLNTIARAEEGKVPDVKVGEAKVADAKVQAEVGAKETAKVDAPVEAEGAVDAIAPADVKADLKTKEETDFHTEPEQADSEKKAADTVIEPQKSSIPLVIITSNRPSYLKKCLEKVLAVSNGQHEIIVSQDGYDTTISQFLKPYVKKKMLRHFQHDNTKKGRDGTQKIAAHYKFALNLMFRSFGYDQAAFLEDDLEIADDFFAYFDAMLPILKSDKDLFCVSAWNDFGKHPYASDPKQFHRTDFFPGLGWMIQRSVWDEWEPIWSNGDHWDNVVRRRYRKGRSCIRPEVSRTYTFGDKGNSVNQNVFNKHFLDIKLNEEVVQFEAIDLDYLRSTPSYVAYLRSLFRKSQETNLDVIENFKNGNKILRMKYSQESFDKYLRYFHFISGGEGMQRTSYRGVIPFRYEGNEVLLYTLEALEWIS